MVRKLIGILTLAACLPLAGAAPAAPPEPFAAARARGELVIGMPYVAPPPLAGAKIRTPDGLDVAVAEKLAQRLGLPFSLRQLAAGEAAAALASGQVDVALADRADAEAALRAGAPLSWQGTGYAARPKAVIRSDTRMRVGADARGRSVCMAQAATAAQELARSWGAVVRTYRVPSDALVAVREGDCDVGLVDDALWEPLMRFPEWKKFSSTLAADGARAERVWLVPASSAADKAWLAMEMRAWDRAGAWKALASKWARDVAFDVYLDQEVPDCHG